MQFESKFGIGEIVAYEPRQRGEKPYDSFLEVVAIVFGMDCEINYVCRYPGTGVTVSFKECQLNGDPDFDQDTGRYHE